MKRVGFTGTSKGMTSQQMSAFRRFIRVMEILEFHHGDCEGADAEAHQIMREEWPKVPIIGHPPSDPKTRAYCDFDRVLDPKPYLSRDKDIAIGVDLLIAIPQGFKEVLRSGTWSTVRYARQARVPVDIIWPDGRIRA